MIFWANRIIILFSILLICTGPTFGKCSDNELDCCGICYYPYLEECINCKVVEKSIQVPQPLEPTPTGTSVENIYDLIEEDKIDVEATGSGISSLSLKIEPKVDFNIKVNIPAGTFFSANRGSTQNMVSTKSKTVEVEIEPGLDIGVEEKEHPPTYVDVSVACANLHKDVPASTDTFTIERAPNQEELEMLLAVLDAEDASYPVEQAAIWIITDDADYNDLGTLICGNGERAINESQAAEALRLIDKAGMDINNKAIAKDRDKIRNGDTGEPSCYSERTIVPVSNVIPVTESAAIWIWKCGTCPAGYQGPNENCECWKWVTDTRYV